MFSLQPQVSPPSWRQLPDRLVSVYRQLALSCWEEAIEVPNAPAELQAIATDDRRRALEAAEKGRAAPTAIRTPIQLFSFDLNFTTTLEDELIYSPAPMKAVVRRRMADRFGSGVPYWFAMEFKEGRLHLHGSIGLPRSGLAHDLGRRHLLGVGGWASSGLTDQERRAISFALRVTPVRDFDYLVKRATYPLKDWSNSYSFLGRDPVVTTHALNRAAQKIHAFHREVVRRMIARDYDDARAC